jgi:hypothetical protein
LNHDGRHGSSHKGGSCGDGEKCRFRIYFEHGTIKSLTTGDGVGRKRRVKDNSMVFHLSNQKDRDAVK